MLIKKKKSEKKKRTKKKVKLHIMKYNKLSHGSNEIRPRKSHTTINLHAVYTNLCKTHILNLNSRDASAKTQVTARESCLKFS